MKNNTYPLDQSALYKVHSKGKLAKLLGCSGGDLNSLVIEDNYHEFPLVTHHIIAHPLFYKKSRTIQNPSEKLKKIQRRILKLLNRVDVPSYLYSAVKGRTYIDNANQHKDDKVTFCVDIKGFYQNTDSKKIRSFFIDTMKCSPELAFILTALTCYKDKISKITMLPTGGPLSPVLSFWVNRAMFEELHKFAQSHQLTMTVYVDDLTFSGARISMQMQKKIKSIVASHHYKAHKFKYFTEGSWKKITGSAVKDGIITAPNKLKAKTRVALREYDLNPQKREQLSKTIRGLASSIGQFCPNQPANILMKIKNKAV